MDPPKQSPLHKRLGWFFLLYAAGFLAVLIVAGLFRVLVLDAVR
ncbi:hypothetical protein [Rhodanobacter sp. BL-MT-08]